MVNFIFIAIVVIYIYACIGVSLLHGHLEPKHLYDGDPGEREEDFFSATDDGETFEIFTSLTHSHTRLSQLLCLLLSFLFFFTSF